MSVITAEEFQAKVKKVFENDRPGPFAVVRVYGVDLGKISPEIEDYAVKFGDEYAGMTIGWFGPAGDQTCIAYVEESFTEMFDGGVGCLESMVISARGLHPLFKRDGELLDFIEAMGFMSYTYNDVQWRIAVTSFG